ncbi:MAG: RpiB/LacA/LacB family sugar-phosphate isomerase, partial [Clostridia bacterium]|nr:RpiB/LacA/LacB family sugar-phosphate isomerase [Clostridia bacterium]
GIGMSIAANKIKGARAALLHDEFSAEMTRRHNNSNILCIGAKIVESEEKACRLADIFLSTEFEGGRHERRVNMFE